jgi:hypothetical protein
VTNSFRKKKIYSTNERAQNAPFFSSFLLGFGGERDLLVFSSIFLREDG